MKILIDRTMKDIQAGQQSWRVLMAGSMFSLVATLAYLAVVNG